MSRVAKSESPAYRDARLYCRRRHQKTMGKCAREERQGDALLTRKLRHIQKSKTYREKELDREQEKCLTDLVAIFDRQCQIATTRLARRLRDALDDKDIVDSFWGQGNDGREHLGSTLRENAKYTGKPTFTGKIQNSTANHPHVLPKVMNGKTSRGQCYTSRQFLPGNSATLGINFPSRESRIRPDSPRPCQRTPQPAGPQPTPTMNQHQLFRNQVGIRESVQLDQMNRGAARRPTRPKTAPQTGVRSPATTRRWDELASPVRCPQHCKDAPPHPSQARSLHCLLHDKKFDEESVTPDLNAPEDVCFRRQYLACVMSRKLPVSGLRSGSFAQQDDVRKKMEARKRCMEELRMTSRQRAKSAPAGYARMSDNNIQAS